MQRNENPYKSPQTSPHAGGFEHGRAFGPLKAPAIALLVCGGLSLTHRLLHFALVIVVNLERRGAFAAELANDFDDFWYIYLANFLCGCAAIYGAVQMLRGRQYPACVLGAIAGVIPILSPCYVLGIPFGVWALVILLQRDTRAAFAEGAAQP